MKKINNNYQSYKILLDNSKNNYYKSSYISNREDSNNIDNSIMRGEGDLDDKRDNLIKKKMIAKNDELIYKYESAQFNKNILNLNKEYDLLIDNALNLEKTKTHFVQSLLDKYKKYLLDYVKLINDFINEIDKFNTKEIGQNDEIINHNKC